MYSKEYENNKHKYTFMRNRNYKELKLYPQDGCTEISSSGFWDDPDLDSENSFGTLTIHKGFTTIGALAFFGNTKLTTIYLPSTLTSVGGFFFLWVLEQ